MTLSAKCVRDIMLFLNDNLVYDQDISIPNEKLDYSKDELIYTCEKLKEANLIIGKKNILGLFEIEDITNNGHVFISKIKDDKFWSKILSKISNLAEPLTIAILEKLITDIPVVS